MADDDLNFEDRYADVPVDPLDEETAAKKAELLKLVAPPPPVQPPQLEPPTRTMPAVPSAPEPTGLLSRLFSPMAVPKFMPGAPSAAPPPPPPEQKVEPKDVERIAQEIEKQPQAPTDTGEHLLPGSRAAILAQEMQGGAAGDARNVAVRQAGQTKKFRGFSPEVDSAIVKAAQTVGVDPDMIRAMVAIESGGDPNSNRNKATQYKGLSQIGREEWKRVGQGDIYNPNDNMMGMARLIKENQDDFRRNFHRDPTPSELYLMHQQGLGFYTRGKMTNIGGNLPASAKGNPANLTHDGFERFWSNELNRRMAEAKGAQVTGSLPMQQLAAFMSPQPTAEQKSELTGGLTNTPIAAAQTAQLMSGTPIEQIKGIADKVNQATIRGAIRNQPGQVPRGVAPLLRQQGVEGPDLSVSHTSPTMPIPGMPSTILPSTLSNPAIMTTPNMLSSAAATMALQAPPPTPEGKDLATPQPSFLDKLKGLVSGNDMKFDAAGDIQKNMDTWSGYNTPDFLSRLGQAAQGVGAGVAEIPTNLVGGVVAPVAAGAGLLTDSPTLKQFGAQTGADTEEIRKTVLKYAGIDPENMTTPQQIGETIGNAVNLGGVVKTGWNAAVQGIANHFLGPAAQSLGQNYPIPSLIPSAHAATVFGAPPVVVQTPGGPVVMNDAGVSGLVYGGLMSLGFGAAVSQTTRAVRMVREAPWMRGITDPRRDVPGAPGTIASSLPEDLLKAGTLNPTQALLDIADRQARYEHGVRVGLDPAAADYVTQKYRVQTGAGADNLIHNATQDGNMVTDDFRFNVPNSIGAISDFSKQNPMFMVYMKAQMLFDQLADNEQKRTALPITSTRRANYPSRYTDVDGQHWDMASTRQTIIDLESRHPEFQPMHGEYLNNLGETRRFVSDGIHNLENDHDLLDHTIGKPSHPIFSTAKNSKTIIDRVLDNDNPLRIAEDEMKFALSKQMKYDAEQHYMGFSAADAFTPRTPEWVSRRGQVATQNGAVLRRRLDGQSVYYTADPLVVSIMNSGDAPVGSWGKFFSSSKNLFQSATTGVYAPSFAPTGGLRAMEQGFVTAPKGIRTASGWKVRPAGPLSSAYAIPAQLMPRIAEAGAKSLDWFNDRVSQTPLQHIIDPQYIDVISQTLHKAYNTSFYKRMRDAGAYGQSTLQEARDTHNAITRMKIGADPHTAPIFDYIHRASKLWNKAIHPLNEGLRAVQEAPNFAFAYKAGKFGTPTMEVGPNRISHHMSDAELAMRMRDYTGDPSTKGFIYSKSLSGKNETLRYSGPGQGRAQVYTSMAKGVNAGRAVIPWSGVLLSSPASTLAALRDNPVRANMLMTMTAVMPEIVAYMWNMNQGQQYIDYMMDGRSDGRQYNNIYLAKPGAKPWEGYEIPHYQEVIFTRAMTRAFMQQYYGRNMTNMAEDSWNALKGLAKGAIIPPQPSPVTAGLGSFGIVAPEGWGGNMYERRSNPYEGIAGGDSPTELTLRAIAPSIADIVLHAMDVTKSMPKDASIWDTAGTAAKDTGHRMLARTALVRDALGVHPQVSGSTPVTEELYKYQHAIDDLEKRYRRWEKGGGDTSLKGGSKAGMAKVAPYMPQLPPNDGSKIPNVGTGLGEPKNPMYKMLMNEMEKNFASDSGSGYKSMWKNYTVWTDLIRKMKPVNAGNEGAWVKRQESKPGLVAYLQKNNVNPRSYEDVRNFYTSRRNEVAQKILFTIKGTEARISKMPAVQAKLGGRPFTILDVDPDKTDF